MSMNSSSTNGTNSTNSTYSTSNGWNVNWLPWSFFITSIYTITIYLGTYLPGT